MDEHPTPESTVMGWWLTMQTRKLDALEHMTLPDYIAVGGPFGRTIGREVMLEQAKRFLFNSVIDDWSVTDLEVRRHGDVSVCSYLWTERGKHNGKAYEIGGIATDVLVRRGGHWLIQAHHVSVNGPGITYE
jgi:ketosteroid isomerase-like protein